ncbi:hypothetical protein M513_12169 [Trichuris suis]|uniref:BED-type domain-containing protein n=1 Tax=Trichuris suis TaxID=68888 RepID=A0A085LPT3_9BILA|nr:hypothetical protein M513_12169 [Trichuris suis]
MCLICEKVFSNESMKPSRLQEHLKRVHADTSKKDMAYFQSLWEEFRKGPTLRSMLSSPLQEENDGLLASYNISLLIAKSGKPHSTGKELLLPLISEVVRTLLHISPTEIIRKIPLSNNTEQRRISEMSSDTEETLCNFLRTTSFVLQLDESTLLFFTMAETKKMQAIQLGVFEIWVYPFTS